MKKILLLSLIHIFLYSCAVTPGTDVGPNSEIEAEINIRQQSTIISTNSTFNFQQTLVGSSSSLTFTVENQNKGVKNLTLENGVTISGDSSFSIVSQPGSSILKPREAKDFIISFIPGSEGVKEAVVAIKSDDLDEGTYTFTIRGEAVPKPINRPNITISSSVSGTTNISSIPVTITFSKAVNNFVEGDVQVSNGTLSGFTSVNAGLQYTVNVAPQNSGAVKVWIDENTVTDGEYGNTASNEYLVFYDGTQPGISIQSSQSGYTNLSPFPVSFVFTEEIKAGEFTAGDIEVVNGTLSSLNSSDNITYTAMITPDSNGVTVTIDVASGKATDLTGNQNTAATQFSITYDASRPTVSITADKTVANSTGFTATIEFSTEVNGFTSAIVTVNNGSKGAFTEVTPNKKWTLAVTPSASPVTVQVADSVVKDSASDTNWNLASSTLSVVYDSSQPTVSLSGPAGPVEGNFDVTITFGEDVAGLSAGNISVGNGSVSNLIEVTPNRVWKATINPSTPGTVTVDVNIGVTQDFAGNTNTAAIQYTVTFEGPDISKLKVSESGAEINESDIYDMGTTVYTGYKTQEFTMENSGTADLEVYSIQSSSGEFIVENISATTIAALGNASFNVKFQPSGYGDGKSAQITVSTNGGTRTFTVTANAALNSYYASIQLKKESTVIPAEGDINFGSTGTSVDLTLTIRNNSDVAISYLYITVNDNYLYKFSYAGTSYISLAAGEEKNITISFTPGGVGDFTGTLTLNANTNGVYNTYSLRGTGN